MRRSALFATAAALALAGASGFLASQAFSSGAAQATRTVTVSVHNGATGPPGPPGPRGERGATGPPGATTCRAGFERGTLVINHPGGQVTIDTCLETP